MNTLKRRLFYSAAVIALALICLTSDNAQGKLTYDVLGDKESAVVIPASFYFAGLSAPTQMRNAAAARIGKDRLVIVGMVDTSGYSTEISGKYEGFFITDSAIKIGDKNLGTGAYGFGFSKDGRLNIFDISSKQILSVAAQNDPDMKRPRPLQMVTAANGIRFYNGKTYVLVSRR